MVEAVSPLDRLALPGRYGRVPVDEAPVDVSLSARTCASLVQLTCWPDGQDQAVGELEKLTGLKIAAGNGSPESDQFTIMPVGPGRYLIEGTGEGLEDELRQVIPVETGAVTGLSHGRVVVSVVGPKAEWVLSKGIAVDFSQAAFPFATSVVTSHHSIGLTIRRTGETSFDLYVFTSLARSFWSWLESAAGETGYEVV